MNALNVRDVVEKFSLGTVVSVEGWVVFVDGDLSLIDMEYGDDYRVASRIVILNKGLAKVIEENVALYGGGESVFFHHAKLVGVLAVESGLRIGINVDEISIEDNGRWLIFNDAGGVCSTHKEEKLNWFDIFKE